VRREQLEPSTNQLRRIMRDDYPALFRSSDTVSLAAQRTYLCIQRVYLLCLVFSGLCEAVTRLTGAALATWLDSIVAVVLVTGLLLLWVSRARRHQEIWFDCRAVAESAKTATWRYMMRVPPFQDATSADALFISELREIRNARPGFRKSLAGALDASADEISGHMRKAREMSLDSRKRFYRNARLRDQRQWYSGKSNAHSRAASRWFRAVLVLHAMAIGLAIVKAVIGGIPIDIVSILVTFAVAVVAWNRTKRNEGLAQAYSLAAQELGELEALSDGICAEGDFAEFVEQVEEAISREHTMWCARRNVLLSS